MATKAEALLRKCEEFIRDTAKFGSPWPALKMADEIDRFLEKRK